MKVLTLMNYIRQICAMKRTSITNLREQEWVMYLDELDVDERNIRRSAGACETGEEILLEIAYPVPATCPPLPESLNGWIATPQWEDLQVEEVETRPKLSKNRQQILRFHDSEQRVRDFAEWRAARTSWYNNEHAKKKAKEIFGEFYLAYERYRRNEEELEFILGNGFLSGNPKEEQGICHPLLLKRVRVRYRDGLLQVLDTREAVTLHTDVFQEKKGMDGSVVRELRKKIDESGVHPLQPDLGEEFLREMAGMLAAKCRYTGRESRFLDKDKYILYDRPVLFLRRRVIEADRLVAAIMMRIGKVQDITPPLLEIAEEKFFKTKELSEESLGDLWGEPEDLLLAGPASPKQMEIVRRSGEASVTAVQGPPGTGTTQAIVNLLCHFLSQGKRVLVTGLQENALRGVKEELPEGMRSLCATIFQDAERDVEQCARGLFHALENQEPEEMEREAEGLRKRREETRDAIHSCRRALARLLESEKNHTFTYEGEEYSLSRMARFVHEHEELLEVIPGRIREGNQLPLSREEVVRLYGSNALFHRQELEEMAEDLPKSDDLLTPENLEVLFREQGILRDKQRGLLMELPDWSVEEEELLYRYGQVVTKFQMDPFLEAEEDYRRMDFMWLGSLWAKEAILAGKEGGGSRIVWDQLGMDIKAVKELKNQAAPLLLGRSIDCPEEIILDSRIPGELRAMGAAFDAQGKLPLMQRMRHSAWRDLGRQILLDTQELRSREDCETAAVYLELQQARRRVHLAWNQLLVPCGEPSYEDLQETGDDVDDICGARWEQISFCLDWYEKRRNTFLEHLRQAGIAVEKILPEDTQFMTPRQQLAADFQWMQEEWPQCAALVRLICIEKHALSRNFHQRVSQLSALDSQVAKRMAAAIRCRDVAAYGEEYRRLLWYETHQGKFRERLSLLEKLSAAAPDWAKEISCQQGAFGAEEPPEFLESAWKCRQFHGQLSKLLREDGNRWERRLRRRLAYFRKTGAELAQKLAWQHFLEKYGEGETGQRLEEWCRGEEDGVRRDLGGLLSVIPAWIMPLDRLWETLRPGTGKFDLLIVDKAHQVDVTALPLLYFGKKLLVIGDEEQPHPSFPSSLEEKTRNLAKTALEEKIQHPDLYALGSSLYDIGRTYFGTQALREQFSSAPEIINYSNWLSYEKSLELLGKSENSPFQPMVLYEVTGVHASHQEVNPREAEEIAVLLAVCMEQPEYAGKTFGVISLAGPAQREEIQTKVLERIRIPQLEEHAFLCGTPEDFRGKMRDIVFLSLVAGVEHEDQHCELLSARDESIKKQYNAAVSRGREQVWIFHSMGLSSLRSGDIRRGLLEYATAPKDYLHSYETMELSFHREVAAWLRQYGYRVEAGWSVGPWQVELAILSGERRAAVICEEESLSEEEDFSEELQKKRAVLERLGWAFLHLRGCDFCRSPEEAIGKLDQELQSLGFAPQEENAFGDEERKALVKRIRAAAEGMWRR